MAIQKLRSDMGFNGDDMYHGHEVILVFRAIHTVYIPFIIKQVFSIPKLIDIAPVILNLCRKCTQGKA